MINPRTREVADDAVEPTGPSSESDWDNVPPFDHTQIPSEIKMPKWVWLNVYRLLRDASSNRLSHHELNIEHSRRYKVSFGGKNLLAACCVKKMSELLCALPFVEPVKVDGAMKYSLRLPNATHRFYTYRDKMELMEGKSKTAKKSSSDDDDDIDCDFYSYDAGSVLEATDSQELEEDNIIPKQPVELLPSWGAMPDGLRQKIYRLLTRKYTNGVELKQFRDAFTKFYAMSISNQRDCHMNHDEMFFCLKDILEIDKDEGDRIWIKPRTLAEIDHIHNRRPPEIFSLDAVFGDKKLTKREQYMQKTFGRAPLRQRQPLRLDPVANGFVPIKKFPVDDEQSNMNDSPSTSSSALNDYGRALVDSCVAPKGKMVDLSSPFLLAPGQNNSFSSAAPSSAVSASDSNEVLWDDVNSGQMPQNYATNCQSPLDQSNLKVVDSPPFVFKNVVSLKPVDERFDSMRSTINTRALGNILRGNERSNSKSSQKLAAKAKIKIVKAPAAAGEDCWDEVPAQVPCLRSTEKSVHLRIKECLFTYKDQWIQWQDIYAIYTGYYGSPLTFLPEQGHNLLEVLEKQPESFAFNNQFAVKARPKPHDLNSLSSSFTDFGINKGDIYSGAFEQMPLVINERLQVLVSFIKENGDFYVQISQMEPAFCDLEYDLNTSYNNPFENETYVMKDDKIKEGMPIAIFYEKNFEKNWRRAKIIAVDGDNVFVQQIDFGITSWISKKNIRYLKSLFVVCAVLPCAVLCSLSGIRPDLNKTKVGSISTCIQEIIKDATKIEITVMGKRTADDVPLVSLTAHIDENSVNINEEVVKRNVAFPLLENQKATPINDLNDSRQAEQKALQTLNYFTDTGSSNNSSPVDIAANNLNSVPVNVAVNQFFTTEEPLIDLSTDQIEQPSTSSAPLPQVSSDPEVQIILKMLAQKMNDQTTPDSEKETLLQCLQAFLPR